MKPGMIGMVALVLTGLTACNDVELKELSPTLAIPLVDSRLSVQEILAREDTSELIVVDPASGKLALAYSNNDFSLSASDLLTVPPTTVQRSYAVGQNSTPPAGQEITYGSSEKTLLDPGNIAIHRLLAESGALDMAFTSDFDHDIRIDLTFPDFMKGGVALNLTVELPRNAPSSQQTANLQGYNLNLAPEGVPNTVRISYAVTITTSGEPINADDAVNVQLSFNNLVYQQMDFTSADLSLPVAQDSVLLRIFRSSQDSEVDYRFTNPSVEVGVDNEVSAPFDLFFEQLEMVDAVSGERTEILLDNFPNPQEIAYPMSPGMSERTTFSIDPSKSNVDQVLTPTEKFVVYRLQLNAKNDGQIHSIEKGDRIALDVTALLRLEGYINNWLLVDTADLDFPGEQNFVDDASLRYYVHSVFPAEVQLQVYFLDNEQTLLDSLFTDPDGELNLLPGAPVNEQGRAVEPGITKTKDILLEGPRLDHLLQASQVVVKARIRTTGGQEGKTVAIFDDNYLDIKLGIKGKVKNVLD